MYNLTGSDFNPLACWVAALHGYSAATVAALGRALSSNQVASAVGDGFVVPVVRDVLRAALAAAWG